MDIKRVTGDYSVTKAIPTVRPKNRGREAIRTVCDTKITGTPCVYTNIAHPTGFHKKIKTILGTKCIAGPPG